MKPGSTCLFVFALAFSCSPAYAQTFPGKPIRLVVGSYPGGGIDLAGRIIAQNYRPKRSDKFKGPENALFDIADHPWIGAGPVKQGAK